jgi:hypothetical protein
MGPVVSNLRDKNHIPRSILVQSSHFANWTAGPVRLGQGGAWVMVLGLLAPTVPPPLFQFKLRFHTKVFLHCGSQSSQKIALLMVPIVSPRESTGFLLCCVIPHGIQTVLIVGACEGGGDSPPQV